MTRYLLDSTVLIDVSRKRRNTRAWFRRQNVADLYLSVISVGEIHRGVYQRRRSNGEALVDALQQLHEVTFQPFLGRILPFDQQAAEIWGRLMGEGADRGRVPPSDDAKIAAIALQNGMTVATSNRAHLAGLVDVLDPRDPAT